MWLLEVNFKYFSAVSLSRSSTMVSAIFAPPLDSCRLPALSQRAALAAPSPLLRSVADLTMSTNPSQDSVYQVQVRYGDTPASVAQQVSNALGSTVTEDDVLAANPRAVKGPPGRVALVPGKILTFEAARPSNVRPLGCTVELPATQREGGSSHG